MYQIVMEWNGMEKLYLNRVALSARRLVSIGALYLDINYIRIYKLQYISTKYYRNQFRHFQVPHQ